MTSHVGRTLSAAASDSALTYAKLIRPLQPHRAAKTPKQNSSMLGWFWVSFKAKSALADKPALGRLSVFQRFAEVTQPGRRGSGRQEATPRPPGAGTRIALLQTALRRPLSKLMTRTTNPTTSNKWTRLPPTCRLKPRSHKIRRTTKMVQSMSPSCAHS